MSRRWFGRGLALALLVGLVACGGDPPGSGEETPAAPTNVTVVAGAAFVDVSWEHDGLHATGFAIYREVEAVGAAAAGTPLANAGASARTYRDASAEPGVPYRYAVTATGSGGRSSEPAFHGGEPVAADEPPTIEFELAWEALAARGDVRSLAFTPDGQHVATGVLLGRAHVWDLTTGEEVLSVPTTSTVAALGVSPDGAILATAGSSLQLWDLEDGRSLRRTNLDEHIEGGARDWANALSFSPDGSAIAVGSDNGTVRVWSVEDGDLLLLIDLKPQAEPSVAPAAAAWDRTVFVVAEGAAGEAPAMEPQILPAVTSNQVRTVAYNPSGSLLASGSADGVVRLWDAATGELESSIAAFGNAVADVAFSPDGASIAASSMSVTGAVAVWDAATGDLVRVIDSGFATAVFDLAYAPDGSRLAGAGADGRLFVWDAAGVEDAAVVQAQRSRANAVAYDPSGDFIATAGGPKDGTAVLRAAGTLTPTRTLQHLGGVGDVAISPDGAQVASGASDGTVASWDALTGEQRFIDETRTWTTSLAYSLDGSRLAAGHGAGVDVLDNLTGSRVWALASGGPLVFSVAFDPAGNRIAAGGAGGSMWLWDAGTGELLHAIAAFPSGQVESMAFTPDGSKVVSGVGYVASPASFAVWDSATGAEVARRDANDHGVFALAFGDDGATMFSAGRSPLRVWDTTTWAVSESIEHAGTASAVVATEEFLIVGGWGMTAVSVIERASGEVVASLPVRSATLGFHEASGRLVVANGAYVQMWELKNR